jgi:hypothetical protein
MIPDCGEIAVFLEGWRISLMAPEFDTLHLSRTVDEWQNDGGRTIRERQDAGRLFCPPRSASICLGFKSAAYHSSASAALVNTGENGAGSVFWTSFVHVTR